jgi:hypothetical protein
MAHRQMVRHWTLTPAFQGSNPCGPVKIKSSNDISLLLFCLTHQFYLETDATHLNNQEFLSDTSQPVRLELMDIHNQ